MSEFTFGRLVINFVRYCYNYGRLVVYVKDVTHRVLVGEDLKFGKEKEKMLGEN